MPEYDSSSTRRSTRARSPGSCSNRPESRNAQNRELLVELDDAFLEAEADDQVRVVILGGAGPIFSSGHDMGSKDHVASDAR